MTKKAIVQAAAAILALLAAVLTAVLPGIEDGPMGWPEWVNVGILAAGAINVYNAANLPGYRYAKLIASVVSTVGVLLVSFLSDGALTTTEIIQIVVAIGGSFGVRQVPNNHTTDGVFVGGPHRVTPAA
jgi:hypothetical protein